MEHSINSQQFIEKVYEISWGYNPNLDEASSFKEVLENLSKMKDSALKMELIESTIKEPKLPNFDNSPERFKQLAHDRMAQRQGQL